MTATVDAVFDTALRAHQAGDLARAEAGYNSVLQLQPTHAPALHYLGLIAAQRGNPQQAIALIERALAAQPNLSEARFNLGNVFREIGQPDRAETCYRAVLRAEPGNPAALLNLANLLRDTNCLDEAERILRRLVAAAPGLSDAYGSLGAVLLDLGKIDEAIDLLRRASQQVPRQSRPLFNLGVALEKRGDLVGAEAHYRRALALSPRDPETLNNLGSALLARRQNGEALAIFSELARQHPDGVGYRRNLAIALHRNGRLAAAAQTYQDLLTALPADAALHGNLGAVFSDQGRIDDAIESYRRSLALNPSNAAVRSNMLFALSFKEDADPQDVYREHRRFDELHALPLSAAARPHANSREAARRLRVGYVSPDFHRHPCGHFLLPAFEHHDRESFELFAYSAWPYEGDFANRFRRAADHWIDAQTLSDEALAERVRTDGIDILVDCAGHMNKNRLLAFARRPAPIQVSFPLYPNTTGLSAMSYRIMDPNFAPPSADALHSERIIRLPYTHVCYEPGNRAIAVAPEPPSMKHGFVTFGSFNNMAKIGARTIAAWAQILHAVPSSHLRMKWLGLGDSAASWLLARFADYGIDRQRISLAGWAPDPYPPYLEIDICLDPLHANGGTTTCDALWMGVPVVSRFGATPFSRVGLGHLTNVGLTELVAADDNGYVRLAAELARSPERLASLRTGLRERFARSPLMDAPRYARDLEEAYRRCWIEWCRSG